MNTVLAKQPKRLRSMMGLFVSLVFGNANERVIFPLFTLVFFDINSHLLPSTATHATRSYWYGLCMALPSFTNLIAAPILSALSDHYGRKKLLLLSYLGAACSGGLMTLGILNQHILLFAMGVFMLGLFSRTNPLGQAAIGDMALNEKNKLILIGRLQTAVAFGAFLGPLLGGYCAYWLFSQLNFSAAFIFSVIFGLIGALVCLCYFHETLIQPQQSYRIKQLLLNSVMILAQRKTISLALILACGQFTWSLYYQYTPPIVKLTQDFSAQTLGLFVGLMALWVMLGGTVFIALLRHKLSTKQCLPAGLILQLTGALMILVGFHLNQSTWLIWLSSLFMASGDVVVFSVITTLYSNQYETQQGQAMGACYLNAGIIWTITGLLGGYLMAFGTLLPLYIAPITLIIALLVWLIT